MNVAPYDAIVVGSGAGGAAAAYRLVRAGWRVALIEKGLRLPRDGSTLDLERVIRRGEFLSREIWRDGRGRRFAPEEHFNVGGKTKWYGAALLRFSPQEFESEPAYGCAGWPIRYADLAAFYDEAEQLLGVREFPLEPGLARILAPLTAPGSPWTTAPLPLALAPGIVHDALEASHFDGFASVRALKGDAEQSLLARVLGDPRLTLLTGVEVTALLPAESGPTRVRGVRVADGRVLLARHVLLAAGALHSPRLLHRYVQQQGIADRLPAAAQIGRNLKLHLLTAMVAVGARRQLDLLRKTTVLFHRRYPHSSVQPLGFDGELMATLLPRLLPRRLALAVGDRAYGFFLQTEDGSDPRNRVIDAQPGIPPALDYDAGRLAAARREHRGLTHALRRSLLGAGLVAVSRRVGLAGTAHACGSLIAGNDPLTAVVDARGRVHGLEGLYVVDGSVLPRSSRVNPSLTIYAWALRTADLLAREAP